ncbi:MAG: ABC transporter substrate-binding protein [Alphaproteobacteria bacterium]|nr:ABC transporter substrate-binding protein [Alphaproteobacteria bacterium]MBV9553331.1 ABC transporter substrate-binding protein [Alphaproteobacteria bacterium]
MTRRWFAILALICCAVTAAAPPRAAAQADPVAFINQLGVQAIQVLGPSVPAAPRVQRFRELLAGNFDLPAIGRFVLGRYWRVATPEQQQQFIGLLQEYLAQAYAGRLAQYAGEKFSALSAQPQGEETVVFSEITRNDGGKIRVEWHLVNNGGWKIVDAYVAGVSMAVTERDEFAAVIQQGGGQVQYLLDRLRQKVAG